MSSTMDDDQAPAVSYLTSVTGECSTCGAPLKWAEIRKWRDEAGRLTITERMLVCQNNHLTADHDTTSAAIEG